MTVENTTFNVTPGQELAPPYVGPKDHELLQRIKDAGASAVLQFGTRQLMFASRVCMENDVPFPEGLDSLDVTELSLGVSPEVTHGA